MVSNRGSPSEFGVPHGGWAKQVLDAARLSKITRGHAQSETIMFAGQKRRAAGGEGHN